MFSPVVRGGETDYSRKQHNFAVWDNPFALAFSKHGGVSGIYEHLKHIRCCAVLTQ